MNPEKLAYLLERQNSIISILESSISNLHAAANDEMQYTLVSEISPHFEVAISKLNTALKLARIKIVLLKTELNHHEYEHPYYC